MSTVPEVVNKLDKMPRRDPVSGAFELTVRCNLHCKMCLFRHDDSENADIRAKELTASQWIDMAKQVSSAGTGSLLITGGEPMFRPDFCEIWEGIYKQGFLIELYTNATLVTDKVMETLKKYPPHRLGVTIYGASRETYEKVCGNPDAFDKMMEGIKKLMTLPSLIEFRTTIIKDNYSDANAIEALIHDNFGEDKKLVQTRLVTKSVRGACTDVAACRLEPEDNVKLAFRRGINLIKDYLGDKYDEKNLRINLETDEDEDSVFEPRITLFGCNAGMSSYVISWNGKLLGCQMLGLFETNALEDGFKSAWTEFPYIVKLPEVNEVCRDCDKKHLCNCCIASRFAETLDPGLPGICMQRCRNY